MIRWCQEDRILSSPKRNGPGPGKMRAPRGYALGLMVDQKQNSSMGYNCLPVFQK